MKTTHVEGRHVADILLYALSTCAWCKKTKQLLNDLGVEYVYVDVDLLSPEDYQKVSSEMKRWNPRGSFPTIVINDEQSIIGFHEDEIRSVAER